MSQYCRTHNVGVYLYIAYIACGSASLYIIMLYFFLTVLALSVASTVANIKIRYDEKTPQFAIFGTRFICVFYSIISRQNTKHKTLKCRLSAQIRCITNIRKEHNMHAKGSVTEPMQRNGIRIRLTEKSYQNNT